MKTPAEFLELLRTYRQSYADGVLAFAQGNHVDGHKHIAVSIKAETDILKAAFPELPL